jgi:acetyl esterase/lipase
MAPARNPSEPSIAIEVREETYPAHSRMHAVRLFRPAKARVSLPVIVFLHGGDFVSGGIEDIGPAATTLAARLNAIVATPTYTLAGEKPFPEAAEDAYAAIRWAHANGSLHGADASRVAVVGEEAGGNLAAVAALMAKDRGGPRLAAQVLISPMLEPTLITRSMRDAASAVGARSAACRMAGYNRYLPAVFDQFHPYAAPAHCSRLAGVAPALIVSAEGDPMRDEADNYGAALIASGVTTQVSRMARDVRKLHRWSEAVWEAIVDFLAPRLVHACRS